MSQTISVEVGPGAIPPEQLADIEYSYMAALLGLALADGILSRAELADLSRVAHLLHIDDGAVDRLVAGAATAARHLPTLNRTGGFSPALAGKTVCFVGTPDCSIAGDRITRAEAMLLAAAAGLLIAPHITAAVDILVTCDAGEGEDAQQARGLGIQVVAERVFWPSLGVDAQ